MSAATSGLEVRALGKTFGSRVAVEGVSFTVSPGEVFGLLGPNGAGKTTTVRMLTGLLEPTQGSATVAGVEIPAGDNGTTLRSRVGLLTESPGLYDRLSARENLQFFARLHRLDAARTFTLATSLLERFELAGRGDEPVGTFSKGMRQKLAIVRTLLHAPPVLFFDEPTSGLDPLSAKVVREVIAEQARDGRTVVLCSHNLVEVERLCSRVAVIKNRLRMLTSLDTLRGLEAVYELRVAGDPLEAAKLLAALVPVGSVKEDDNVIELLLKAESEAPELLRKLSQLPIEVLEFRRQRHQLERAYLHVVSEEESVDPPDAITAKDSRDQK